jgi:outer membrane protein OmpA-like peptidoglycan-associated protein
MVNKVTSSTTQPFPTLTTRNATATPAASPAPAASRTSAAPDISALSASATSGNRPAYSGQALFQTAKSDPRGGTKDLDKMLNQFAADFKKMSPDQQKALLGNPGFRIDVTGYASNSGTKSQYDNQGLSARRASEAAAHVKSYLAKQGVDVPSSAIKSKGAGTPSNPGKPLDNNDQSDRSAKVEIFMPKVVAGGNPPASQQNQPQAGAKPAQPAPAQPVPAQPAPIQQAPAAGGNAQGSGQAQGSGNGQASGGLQGSNGTRGGGTSVQDVANGITALAELAKAFGEIWKGVRNEPWPAQPAPAPNTPEPVVPAQAPIIVTTKKEEEDEKKPAPAPAPAQVKPPAPVVADEGFKGVEGTAVQTVEVPYGGVAAGS